MSPVLLGIDVGTSGVRALVVTPEGRLVADARRPLASRREGLLHEQEPQDWWTALRAAIGDLLPLRPAGIAVTSTSGSLVATGDGGEALRPAILYDDGRATSYSLSKAVWLREHEPAIWDRTRWLLHPADWLAGRLCGQFGKSDYSNCLKLGYDPERRAWSDAVVREGIPPERLPQVGCPGDVMGQLAENDLGLAPGAAVVAGATDGIASLVASGAHLAGHLNTTLGTTLVWKALTRTRPAPGYGLYCHLHPAGWWAPGAASNTGLGALPDGSAENDRAAAAALPSPALCYPLPGRGERYPFFSPHAETFQMGAAGYPAQLQALAFVERWGYEVMEDAGLELGSTVYSTGAAAGSPVLSQLRADVLDRTVQCSCYPWAAFGAAILAATPLFYGGDAGAAIRSMTRPSAIWKPGSGRDRFETLYVRFREACRARGYGA